MIDLDVLNRVRKTTIIIGIPLAIVITFYWGLPVGGGWAAGIAWSLINLYFIGSLVKKVVTTGKPNVSGAVIVMLIKFPVLYAAGLFLLWNGRLAVAGLVAGFSWPFFVLLMKALGRHYLKLDDKKQNGNGTAVQSEGKI